MGTRFPGRTDHTAMSQSQLPPDAPTCSLLVYGSLMDRQELARFDFVGNPVPVVVSGFARHFGQEPSWRRGQGIRRGVLTLRSSRAEFVNAVLVPGVAVGALQDLDQRERGYERCAVAAERISSFGRRPLPDVADPVFSYVGRPELSNPALMPNPEYLEICLAAAAELGGIAFYRFFGKRPLSRGVLSIHERT